MGEFSAVQIGKLVPTYQESTDNPENYGCGFLSDGRLLTTDIGNQSGGDGTGQLIIWFPPLDGPNARYCKLDGAIGTAQNIAVDDQDRVYVASARVDPGVFRYTGPFPTADTRKGGSGGIDLTEAPMVEEGLVSKEKVISDPSVSTAGGLAIKPDGGFYVASLMNGIIGEFDGEGQLIRRMLTPPPDSTLPWPTGSPLGLRLATDGTIYYADIGLVGGPDGAGPGKGMGTVRRIRFVDAEAHPPETLDRGLDSPDGIGVLEY